MSRRLQSTAFRAMAVLIALICMMGLIPAWAQAAGTDSITLERFGYSGVSYESASLGRCQLHQMYYDYGGKTTIGFCGTKGGGMGSGLEGQTWGNPTPITDPTVEILLRSLNRDLHGCRCRRRRRYPLGRWLYLVHECLGPGHPLALPAGFPTVSRGSLRRRADVRV